MNGCSVISLTYNFDYGQFDQPDLQNKAKNTLGKFLSFVRSSFDALIENGRVIQDFYHDCLAFASKVKKVFKEWLASDDSKNYISEREAEIIAKFGEISEESGLNGWSHRGYRNISGILHKGINAISVFISDLSQEHNYQTSS